MNIPCSLIKAAGNKLLDNPCIFIHKRVQRRYLTLIEMIVVMTIIAFVAGVASINISKAMQEQRFRTEVALVVDKLRLAQNLMLILNEDVKVEFKKVPDGIQYHLTFQCPLNSGWDKELTRKPQLLTAIRQIDFQTTDKVRKSDEFALNFLSKGMVMSQGILKLSTGKGYSYQDRRYICLDGYPSPIMAQSDKKKLPYLLEKETKNNEQLTQHVMPEIIKKFQSLKKKK